MSANEDQSQANTATDTTHGGGLLALTAMMTVGVIAGGAVLVALTVCNLIDGSTGAIDDIDHSIRYVGLAVFAIVGLWMAYGLRESSLDRNLVLLGMDAAMGGLLADLWKSEDAWGLGAVWQLSSAGLFLVGIAAGAWGLFRLVKEHGDNDAA